MGKVIGIDLGTTNSVVAYMDRGEPQVIVNEEGARVTPSVVGVSRSGERFVGDIAKRQLLISPESTVHSIKRLIGRSWTSAQADVRDLSYKVVQSPNGDCAVDIDNRAYSPQEISAMILMKLRKSAEDFLGEAVTECVLTVPAYFTDRQRQATRDAGTIAGLQVLRIVNEPTAAALAYVHDRQKSSTVAVFDFGGGTFDVSILEVDRDVANVLGTRGNNTLGGNDIDGRIVDWLLEQFRQQHGMDVSKDRVVLQRLRDAAERAKISLSTALESEIHLPFLVADATGPKHLQCTLTRGQLESLAQNLFERTVEECRRVLADCNLSANDVDEVILVGGSARIPRVQELVGRLFRCPLNKSFNPDEVVALGAALQGGMLEGSSKAVTLLDVTNLSLGIEVEGRRFARLIPKNSSIPTQITRLVSTVADNQRAVKIHVLQGESPDARENVSLGEFELSGVEPGPRGTPRIEVRFTVDASGIINVRARDLRANRTEELTISAPTGLSQQEIERARDESEQHRQREVAQSHTREVRHQIETQLLALEGFLRDNRGALHRQDTFEVEQALKRGRMALVKNADATSLEEMSVYLARFLAHLVNKLGGSDTPVH